MTDRAFAVVRSGALTTVQDEGRPGHAHLGVPRSGALDRPAAALVNRLVGNPPEAAVLETTLNGCAVRPRCAVTVAVGGAPCPVTVDGRPVPWGMPVRVPAGALLDVGTAVSGVRGYLALSGGVAVEPVLGSRSTDLLSGLGPPPLANGAVLPLGDATAAHARVDVVPHAAPPSELVLRLTAGPRADWFTPDALRTLATRAYRVSSASNRIGLRTEGPPLDRAVSGELPSEGMVLGAVQVPPDGRPVVFLADHPTTGGYPVVGVVRPADLAGAAQAVPGTRVRFVVTGALTPPPG
ncbi:biotin-dependent carboxyltransferase family protein [Streptomyces sp. NRRL B-1347]|uniref:5-oxoprolinase subunit C family protein n=1 Tax=Streptomyces sp. NRRL B-1347 TaxID=1476877 RepID=UPI0004C9BD15|nr:biotin-dependent carboxyltransferase family protein [Streptomyces sp. NRRL B-1347]